MHVAPTVLVRTALAVALIVGTARPPIPLAAQEAGSADHGIPEYPDAAALQAGARETVEAFARAVATLALDLGDSPAVEVRSTPMLIFFSPGDNQITVPWWEDLSPEQHALFDTWGGDRAGGERLFRALFHRFLVIHEAGHWLQSRSDQRKATLYENELDANRIAVAFWRTAPDGEAFLAEVETLLERCVATTPDPTPPGEDAAAFFNANYRELGRDPVRYAFYQFRFMLDAVRERDGLHLSDWVADPSHH
jgi:hypothetical protein